MKWQRIVTLAIVLSTPLAARLAAQQGITAEQAVAMRQLSNVRISPDGKWVAYQSNASGPLEVYVRPFLASGGTSDAQWQISRAGGGC